MDGPKMTYHYTMCGLDYVYLRNGYRTHETEYGQGISIERADGLDRMIALIIITSHSRLRGQEVRFLRSLIDFSQAEIAAELGVKRVTVARWEGATHTPIPGPADRVLRLKVAYQLFDLDVVGIIISLLPEITDTTLRQLFMTYIPDDTDKELSLFPDLHPEPEGWRPSKVA